MAKIKYLGTAHVHTLEPGEDWGGRLADPLTKQVKWDIDNHFLVDTEDVGMPSTAVQLLLEDSANFVDVTGRDRVPISAAENLWYGISDKEYEDQHPVVDADGTLHRDGT